jgi:subtilase family serine protease
MAVQDPSAQPWCCGVGGTAVTDNSSLGYVKETTWNELSSDFGDGGAGGGGISVNWPIPAYQAPSVTAASLGSTAYRNIPDVSLNSDPDMLPYDVYFSDPDQGPGDYGYGGTSCAAPLWAGFTARVNQARLTAKLPLLGFPNTALYAIGRNATEYAADFHDIADNSNNGVFPAVKGYDLATGLGSFSGKSLFTQLATMTNTFSGVPTPISLAAPAASAAVSLTWYDDTPAGATFKVYRASGPVGPWTLLGTVSTKSYKNTGLTNGTTYYYEVEAVSGSSTSAMSQPYAVTPVASFTSTTPVVTIAPKYQGSQQNQQLLIKWTTSAASWVSITLTATGLGSVGPVDNKVLSVNHAFSFNLENAFGTNPGQHWTYTVTSYDGSSAVSKSGSFTQP